MTETKTSEPFSFTVEHWSAFWASPDASLVGAVTTPDVVGDWAGDPEPVRGADAYRDRIADVLDRVPDLHLEATAHAQSGDVIFIHWLAHGTGENGSFELDGIDRIRLENGLVKENVIRFDPGELEALIGAGAPGK